jgi:hypothetical protein
MLYTFDISKNFCLATTSFNYKLIISAILNNVRCLFSSTPVDPTLPAAPTPSGLHSADPNTRHNPNKYLPCDAGRIAIGSSDAMVFNQSVATFTIAFQRNFTNTPRIGLSVYTMNFDYSPTFSCLVSNVTSLSGAIIQVSTADASQNNQLFLIYMATDHPYLGIFMPPALSTFGLMQ